MKKYGIVISTNEPNAKDCLWLKPMDGGMALMVLNNGNWQSIRLVNDQGTGTISDDKVINFNDFSTTLEVTDITALTKAQIEGLKAGDMVLKKDATGVHSYRVSYKSTTGLCLTYSDCENVETVAYEKSGSTWAYDSTDVTHIKQETVVNGEP